jgi:hypothetical protein
MKLFSRLNAFTLYISVLLVCFSVIVYAMFQCVNFNTLTFNDSEIAMREYRLRESSKANIEPEGICRFFSIPLYLRRIPNT